MISPSSNNRACEHLISLHLNFYSTGNINYDFNEGSDWPGVTSVIKVPMMFDRH